MENQNENIINLPKEVDDFIYSSKYAEGIDQISKKFGFTEEQKKVLDYSIEDILKEKISNKEFADILKSFNLAPVLVEQLVSEIENLFVVPVYEKMIEKIRSQDIDEEIEELEKIIGEKESNMLTSTDTVTAPSPSDMVARLGQTLKQPTTIAPVRRDYSLDRTEVNSVASSKKAGDPYREIPN